ncbi:MAG: GspMb/PilO family protein [Acidobacteriaceae bacterium]
MIANRQMRDRFLVAIVILGAICLICVVYLLLPANRNTAQKDQAIQGARAALRAEEVQALPLRGLDQKLATSKQDIAGFYNSRLPDRYSAISQTLNDLATKNNVKLSGVTYKSQATDLEDVQQVAMRVTLTGEYGNVMRYIDAVDHAKIFFLLENVGVTSQQSGNIQLQLTLSTYLRGGAAAGTAPTA